MVFVRILICNGRSFTNVGVVHIINTSHPSFENPASANDWGRSKEICGSVKFCFNTKKALLTSKHNSFVLL